MEARNNTLNACLFEKIRAIFLVQGGSVAMRKAANYVAQVLKISLGNEIVPTIRREAYRARYGTYIDIGACQGDTILPVAHLFDQCIAIEPDPRNYKLLQKNLERISNCLVLNCALGARSEQRILYIEDRTDQSTLTPLGGFGEGGVVFVDTLDTVVERFHLAPPYLIKIDVQGSEYAVLCGAAKVLGNQSTIILEFWPFGLLNSGTEPAELLRLMSDFGFLSYNLGLRKVAKDRMAKFVDLGRTKPTIFTDVVFRKS